MPTDRRASLFVAAVFLAIIAAPGLIQTAAELGRGETPRALDVFARPPTAANLHDYERGLQETSLVVRRLRPWMQYLQWSLLADAGEKVVVGRRGWLFYRPSVGYLVERPAGSAGTELAGPLAAIRSFRDQLRARGIGLLVVPAPNKESVYPDRLSRRAEGAGVIMCAETRRLFEELAQSGIDCVDLFEVFRRARQAESPTEPGRLYLSRDTHWSPEGARMAAAAVARRLLDEGAIRRGDRDYVERPVTVDRPGDLVEMLHVPRIERALESGRLECRQVLDPGTGKPYRDAADSEVLVLGDSFLRVFESDEPGAAGFLAHLARGLGRPLAAIVNDGGASTPVRRELARRPSLLAGKKLVIWEFAEREIRYGTEGWPIIPLTRSKPTPR